MPLVSEHTYSTRLMSMSALCHTLSSLFCYPTREQAYIFTSREFIDELFDVVRESEVRADGVEKALIAAREQSDPLDDLQDHRPLWGDQGQNAPIQVRELRKESTRLFYGSGREIPLTGAQWVLSRERTKESWNFGEPYAVSLCYRRQGLKVKLDSDLPADHIVSELDFLGFLINHEALSWDDGDAATARMWSEVRSDFVRDHFMSMGYGVCCRIRLVSSNVFFRYYERVLSAVTNALIEQAGLQRF